MFKIFSITAASVACLLLAACGGGANDNGNPFTQPVLVTSLVVSSDLSTIPADGSQVAHITIVATDANSLPVSAVTVYMASSAGNLVAVQWNTDANGVATATLSAGSAAAGTAIAVAFQAEKVKASININVGAAAIPSSSGVNGPADVSRSAKTLAATRSQSDESVASLPVSDSAGSGVSTSTAGGAAGSQAAVGQGVSLLLTAGTHLTAASSTQYSLGFTAVAVDSSGVAINALPVVFSVQSLDYRKGSLVYANDKLTSAGHVECPNEDANGNGLLDPGEDINSNGSLQPGIAASVLPATAVTANGGTAQFQLLYPRDHGFWLQVRVSATATVQGTQTTAASTFWLPTADSGSAGGVPSLFSPFGVGSACVDPN